jgi:hypothetical protein
MRTVPGILLAAVGLVCGLAPAARAQTLNQRGIARLNQDVQTLWTKDGIGLATSAARTEAQALVGVPHAINSKTTATIVGINSITINCPGAPGVKRLDGSGVDVALPLSGTWSVAIDVEVHVKGKILFIPVDQTFSVTMALSQVSAEMSGTFDSSDPSAPKVSHVNPPVVGFNLSVTSTNFIVDVLGWITSDLVNGIGQAVVVAAADYAAQKLDVMLGSTPTVSNAGGPGLPPIARADLEGAAAKLGQQIEQYRRPYGPVVDMLFGPPNYAGTWADSLADPNFNPGTPIAPDYFYDSGEWTGHYLAALA